VSGEIPAFGGRTVSERLQALRPRLATGVLFSGGNDPLQPEGEDVQTVTDNPVYDDDARAACNAVDEDPDLR
jgi:hypothetical protein